MDPVTEPLKIPKKVNILGGKLHALRFFNKSHQLTGAKSI